MASHAEPVKDDIIRDRSFHSVKDTIRRSSFDPMCSASVTQVRNTVYVGVSQVCNSNCNPNRTLQATGRHRN